MMKLEVDRLNGFEFRTEIAGSHGNGVNKKIDVISKVNGDEVLSWFSVINDKKEIVRTPSLELAVDVFNEIK